MSILSKIRRKLYTQKYIVGFLKADELDLPEDERFAKIRWVDLGKYSEGWFADPFILSVDNKHIVLLVEEFLWATERGRISKLVVDANDYRLLSITPLLDIDTHLSFPIYIKEKGNIYVYPENFEGGALRIYRYDEDNESLTDSRMLIERPLLDTQIVKTDDGYFAFGIEYASGKQDDCKHLKIFKAPSLMGPYTLFQEIENDKCQERGAGSIFRDKDGNMIRPVQDCEGDYGLATIFNQLEYSSDEHTFKERRERIILPDYKKRYGRGLHTYNRIGDLCVVDGRGFRYKISDIIKKTFFSR